MEGFEVEAAFNQVFSDIRKYNPDLKYGQLRSAIAGVAPAYIAALGERRACVRKLQYIGCTWNPAFPPADDGFFKLGQMYLSSAFNGATYTIDGYGEHPTGSAYFKWAKEDTRSSNRVRLGEE